MKRPMGAVIAPPVVVRSRSPTFAPLATRTAAPATARAYQICIGDIDFNMPITINIYE
ncbi:hypothetical protein Neosp_013597 [[Neocosmospora] mangrovei]